MGELTIPVNVTTVTLAVAILLTAALWFYLWMDGKSGGPDQFGIGAAISALAGCAGTCFIWMVAFGLMLLLRGCA